MRLIALFAIRQSCLDDMTPELLACWDEYQAEDNPEGMEDTFEKAKRSLGEDLASSRIVELEVSDDELHRLFDRQTLQAEVVKE